MCVTYILIVANLPHGVVSLFASNDGDVVTSSGLTANMQDDAIADVGESGR